MVIILTILFILPGMIASYYYDYLRKEKVNLFDFIMRGVIFICVINMLCCGIMFFTKPINISILEECYRAGFIFKYLLISLFLAFIIPLIIKTKTISFRIEEKQQ
jgi:hypothetical protein